MGIRKTALVTGAAKRDWKADCLLYGRGRL